MLDPKTKLATELRGDLSLMHGVRHWPPLGPGPPAMDGQPYELCHPAVPPAGTLGPSGPVSAGPPSSSVTKSSPCPAFGQGEANQHRAAALMDRPADCGHRVGGAEGLGSCGTQSSWLKSWCY